MRRVAVSVSAVAPILAPSTTSPNCEFGNQFEYQQHEHQQRLVSLSVTCLDVTVASETAHFTRYLTRALDTLPSALSGVEMADFEIQRSEFPETRFNVNGPHKGVIP